MLLILNISYFFKMFRYTCNILLIISAVVGIFGYPETDPEICLNHKDDEKIAILDSCTHYYHCETEIGYLIDCSDYGIYRYDAQLGQCNFADKVVCTAAAHHKTAAVKVPLRDQPLEIDNKISIHAPEYDSKVCRGYKDSVTLGIKGSCTLYYICIDNVGYLEDCALYGSSQYDPRTGQCNLKRKVMCDDSDEIVKSPFNF